MEIISVAAFLVLFALLAAGCDKLLAEKKPYEEGEVLAQFETGFNEDEIRKIVASVNATVKDTIKQQNVYILSFPREISPEVMVEQLKKIPGVKWAEPNYRYEVSGFLGSVAYADEGETDGFPNPSGNPIIVAVIDTGVNPNHSALAGKVVEGYNFYNRTTDANGSPYGVGYHGTASAGRVLDGSGGADIRIMPLQVNDGQSRWLSGGAILQAIYYAVDHGASVINMSFGSPSPSHLMQEAINYANSKGVVCVASAGNSGNNLSQYPAAYQNVIAVGAANADGKMAGFSNFGSYVDLVAPGWNVPGLSWSGERAVNGTSFSAPFLAGLTGLFKYYFPSLGPGQIEMQIKALARNIDDLNPSRTGQMGAGFIGKEEVQKLVESIRDRTFRLAQDLFSALPGVPAPAPAIPGPWLVRGHAHQGTYVLRPDGSVVKQD